MGNGPYELQHVTSVEQRGDNTVVVHVQTDSFKPGRVVEVSVVLTQGGEYATFNGKKHIPYPDDLNNPEPPPVMLHVELPATKLNADQEMTVVTRVSEVWPTVLQQDSEYKGTLGEYMNQRPKAVWSYRVPQGKGPGDGASPSSGDGSGGVPTTPQQ
jgi:hypothetical protein